MKSHISSSISATPSLTPELRFTRLERLLRELEFSKDFSVNATRMSNYLGRSNQEYEASEEGKAYHAELCRRYSLPLESFIQEGRRGRLPKGAEPGSNARRYCKEVALHYAQWADKRLHAELQEAIQLLISGQVTTEASMNVASCLAAAADIGRSGRQASENALDGLVDGMGSLDILPPPSQVLALVEENKALRQQVQALQCRIQDLTEMPVGPSREAEQDHSLWVLERQRAIYQASSNASLAFGPPPLLYVPRCHQICSEIEDAAQSMSGQEFTSNNDSEMESFEDGYWDT